MLGLEQEVLVVQDHLRYLRLHKNPEGLDRPRGPAHPSTRTDMSRGWARASPPAHRQARGPALALRPDLLAHWKSGVTVNSTFRVERVIGCRCTDSSSLGKRWTYLWMVFPILGMRMSCACEDTARTAVAQPHGRSGKPSPEGNGGVPLQARALPSTQWGSADSKLRDQGQGAQH